MPPSPDARAAALTQRGRELIDQGDYADARLVLGQALALWQQLGERAEAARALRWLGVAAYRAGAALEAREYLRQALAAGVALGDLALQADVLADAGQVAASLGETQRAIASYQQSRQLYAQLQSPGAEGRALYLIGKAHQEAGDMQAARPWFLQAFALLRGTAGWTPEVAQTAQLVETVGVAQAVFSTISGRGQPKLSDLQALADLIRAQAGADSSAAAHVAERVDTLMQGLANLADSFDPRHRLEHDLAGLASPDPQQRSAAARALAGYKPAQAIESLVETLEREDDPAVIQELLQALRVYGDASFAARIRPFLQHASAQVRLAAVLALVDLGAADLDQALLEGLNAEDAGLRAQVIQLLEKRADPATAGLLLPLLQDRDPKVRTRAVHTLGTLRARQALDALIAATQDRYQSVRWAAVRVLGDLGDPRAVDALSARLRDSNRDVRRSAATSLGKLKDRRAAEALTRALLDDWWGVRESAQAALRKLKSGPSLLVLLELIRDPDTTLRRDAAVLLAAQQHQDVIPALRSLLDDPDLQVRLAAITALAAHNDRESVPEILAALGGDAALARSETIAALQRLGDPRAEPALIDLLKHDDPYIRFACIQALAELGTRDSLPALATLQLQDTGWISTNNGFDRLSLKTAAASAAQAIRVRANFPGGAHSR